MARTAPILLHGKSHMKNKALQSSEGHWKGLKRSVGVASREGPEVTQLQNNSQQQQSKHWVGRKGEQLPPDGFVSF